MRIPHRAAKSILALVLLASILPATAAYQYRVPAIGLAAPYCTLPWGGDLTNNTSQTGYTQSSVAFGSSCASVQTTVSCTQGHLALNGATSSTCSVAAEADPYWANVTVLADFEGAADGATNYTDAKGNAFVARAGARISTGTAKVGSGSMYNWNTSTSMDSASGLCDLGTGDFTVEGWFYSTSAFSTLISCGDTWNSHSGWYLQRTGFQGWNTSGGVSGATASFDNWANAWHHLAAVRSGGNYRFFIDGNPVATSAGAAVAPANSGFRLGSDINGATSGFNGNIDEIRVTKGVARYWNAFTPRTTAYPKQ